MLQDLDHDFAQIKLHPIHEQDPRRAPRPTHAELAKLDEAAEHIVVEGEGLNIYWRVFGNGQPLLLVHGGHGSWMHWVKNVAHLAKHYKVLVPDLPGFGQSDDFDLDPRDPTRLHRAVDLVIANLHALLGKEAQLGIAAFSFGSLPASEIAIRHPGVRSLVLIGPAGHATGQRPRPDMVNWRVDNRAERRAALQFNLRVFMLHRADSIDELATDVHEYSCSTTRFRSKEVSLSPTLEPILSKFTRPVLFLWGEHDVTARRPAELGQRWCAQRTDRAWELIPDAGHWVQYEAADAVNTKLAHWFSKTLMQPNASSERS